MKKMIAVGIITILTLGLAGCSWFQPAEPTVEQPTVTEEPETTPTDVTEPTEMEEPEEISMQKYSNDDLGISLEYPNDWKVSSESTDNVNLVNTKDAEQVLAITKEKNATDSTDVMSWAEAQEWPMTESASTYFKEIKLGTINALQDPTTNTVYVLNGDVVYRIENGIGMERNVIDEELYFEILDTLKFL
jgi:hypothetical protein